MKSRLLITAAMLCMALPASADFETVSRAYEVALGNMVAPATLNGRVMFKTCDDCDSQSIRVTAETRYVVNGRTVKFERFREAVQRAAGRGKTAVTVLHHLESDTVVSVSVTIRNATRDARE